MANMQKNLGQRVHPVRFKHRAQGPKSSGFLGPIKPRKSSKKIPDEPVSRPLMTPLSELAPMAAPVARLDNPPDSACVAPSMGAEIGASDETGA